MRKLLFSVVFACLLCVGVSFEPSSGRVSVESSANAQSYRYRTPRYRAPVYRAPRYRAPRVASQPNRVRRGIKTLSRWNGNAERRARWAARHPR
ncbi:MAG: hypothetical protein KF730_10690 [Sphingomonas sp.]|uniref:hypothetical protein n=1 Tax=Sphingomonas sp. TaxID=28214 RepID=UPI0025D69389|nr:hypothetical protein [Sphingomonas sp.]MBX3565029.1 hypothetical protein [Sphingomonas sp.]